MKLPKVIPHVNSLYTLVISTLLFYEWLFRYMINNTISGARAAEVDITGDCCLSSAMEGIPHLELIFTINKNAVGLVAQLSVE